MIAMQIPPPGITGPVNIPAGQWLFEDVNAAGVLAHSQGGVVARTIPPEQWPNLRGTEQQERVLLIRPGGFGDLMFLTPLAAEIKRRWPGCRVDIACAPAFASIVPALCHVDGCIEYPFQVDVLDQYTGHVWLENVIENNPRAADLHAVDVLAERAGLEIAGSKAVELTLNHIPPSTPRLAIQWTSSARCRSWPHQHNLDVAKHFHAEGWEVVFFGRPGEVKIAEEERIVNGSTRGWDMMESLRQLSRSTVLLGPDSALVHAAGAMGMPAVAIYGTFPAALRTIHHPSVVPLTGKAPCAPCFHHQRGALQWPALCPAPHGSNWCEALANVSPEDAIQAIEKLTP